MPMGGVFEGHQEGHGHVACMPDQFVPGERLSAKMARGEETQGLCAAFVRAALWQGNNSFFFVGAILSHGIFQRTHLAIFHLDMF